MGRTVSLGLPQAKQLLIARTKRDAQGMYRITEPERRSAFRLAGVNATVFNSLLRDVRRAAELIPSLKTRGVTPEEFAFLRRTIQGQHQPGTPRLNDADLRSLVRTMGGRFVARESS